MAKLALVTGGCRRVGATIAAHLARAGWALALHGHSDAEPDDALAAVLEETGAPWRGFKADLAEPGAPEALIADVAAQMGRTPDLLVNNASLFGESNWQDLDRAALDAHFAVNLYAPVLLSTALVKAAGEGASPAIVHIADQRVRNPVPDQLAYTLAKQALAESVRTLARGFGPRARVNAVAPGLTLGGEEYSDDHLARIAGMMPLRRNSRPDDIAAAVLYLAEAEAVTGQLLFVDGGAHLESFPRDFVHLNRD